MLIVWGPGPKAKIINELIYEFLRTKYKVGVNTLHFPTANTSIYQPENPKQKLKNTGFQKHHLNYINNPGSEHYKISKASLKYQYFVVFAANVLTMLHNECYVPSCFKTISSLAHIPSNIHP